MEAASVHPALRAQRAFFATGTTLPLAYRRAALERLRAALTRWDGALSDAMHQDLGKSAFEAYTGDILLVRQEAAQAIASLHRWAKPRQVRAGWFHWPARASVEWRPRGTTLVLSPWNYPVQLSLVPLVSAVAAGNCVVLKPSELAPATARVLRDLVAETFEPGHAQVVEGGADTAAELSAQPFDHVFFTGSTTVGRQVAVAAAGNLATCTLELGGCNPCIVDDTVDLAVAARRIAWGKYMNAGQTCLAPNHVLVQDTRLDAFLDALRVAVVRQYGTDGQGMARVVNARHFARLAALLPEGRVAHGGRADGQTLHLQPTVVVDVAPGSPLLTEEIFGPILPVVPWSDRRAVIDRVAAEPEPLALYVHSRDDAFVRDCLDATRSGSVAVNDNVLQATVPDLPFGGVGPSGQGRYHGRAGFETFSYARSVLRQSAKVDLPFRYPPYGDRLKLIKRLLR